MRLYRVTVNPPLFNYNLHCLQAVEDFSIETLITRFAVERRRRAWQGSEPILAPLYRIYQLKRTLWRTGYHAFVR